MLRWTIAGKSWEGQRLHVQCLLCESARSQGLSEEPPVVERRFPRLHVRSQLCSNPHAVPMAFPYSLPVERTCGAHVPVYRFYVYPFLT